MSRVRHLISICLLAMLIAASCTSSPEPEQAVVTTTPVQLGRASGFDGSIIRVGVLLDLSGADRGIGRETLTGIETYWAAANAVGGVDGRFPVELVVLDHGGDPARAASALAEQADGLALIAAVGDADIVTALLPVFEDERLLAAPVTRRSSGIVGASVLSHGIPDEELVEAGIGELAARGAQCVVLDDSAFAAPVEAAVANLEGVQTFVVTSDLPVDQAALSVTEAGCAVVWMGLSPTAASAFVALVDASVVVAGVESLVERVDLDAATGTVIAATDAPLWDAEASSGMAELVVALSSYSPDQAPSAHTRRGYVLQQPIESLLASQVLAGDLSREALETAWAAGLTIDAAGLVTDRPRLYRVGDSSGDELGWVPAGEVEG